MLRLAMWPVCRGWIARRNTRSAMSADRRGSRALRLAVVGISVTVGWPTNAAIDSLDDQAPPRRRWCPSLTDRTVRSRGLTAGAPTLRQTVTRHRADRPGVRVQHVGVCELTSPYCLFCVELDRVVPRLHEPFEPATTRNREAARKTYPLRACHRRARSHNVRTGSVAREDSCGLEATRLTRRSSRRWC
jgi:hypothetical protein